MISTKLIALDFGSSSISAMAAEVLENGAVKILSEESKPSDEIRWGIVAKPSGASFKVSELLRLLKNSAKTPDITHVSVSVGAKSMKNLTWSVSRQIGQSNVISKKLLDDMSAECERHFTQPDVTVYGIIPVSYILDGKRVSVPVNMNGIQLMVNYQVVIGHSIIKAELDRCFDRTGVLQEFVPLTVESLSTVLLEEHEREEGCALISMGASTTTLAVYRDHVLQTLVVVPLGASNITKDIEELGINEINAERLKCLKGCALESLVDEPVYIQITAVEPGNPPVKISTKFLATIIEARLDEIMQPIFDAIDNLPFTLEAGIVLTGGGSKLNNIIDYIAYKTGISPRFGNHSDWLSEDTDEKYHNPKYAQMLGTILLTHEYRKDHPMVEVMDDLKKKTKLPKGSYLGGKLTGLFTTYFGDESENKF